MSNANEFIAKLGYLDTLARRDSAIHRLDPRAKVIATLVFIITVVSFGKYSVSALLPFVLFPVVLIAAGDLPSRYLLKRVVWLLPFALLVGMFNPILDRQVLLQIGSVHVTGGWISFLSILIRFFLTVLAAFILVATTGFNTICLALQKIGVPEIFVMQLLFLYRYAFVLADEAARMMRAWQLRAPSRKAIGLPVFSTLLGMLFLRTTERAQRIHQAMRCRAFEGQLHPARHLEWRMRDTVFLATCCLFFMLFRFFNPAVGLGRLITGFFS